MYDLLLTVTSLLILVDLTLGALGYSIVVKTPHIFGK